ncbi:DUF2190 family protein, partial [Arthrospira platensis SPKY1]|nr:DUF2190 family protein [Arthrospira platensis SPKY1]
MGRASREEPDMSKNAVQPGHRLTLPAPSGGVVKERVYLIGALVAMATETAAATVDTVFEVGGVHALRKDGTASVSFNVGETVFWDPTGHLA